MDIKKEQPKLIKVVQVGDLQSGKTKLYLRYNAGKYGNDRYTIGTGFFSKIVKIKEQEVKFLFWEFSYTERFSYYLTQYFKKCSVLVISYDITCRGCFEKVVYFLEDYNQYGGHNLTTFFLVGNKCDLEEERQVSYLEGKQLSESLGMLFMEVSAKEDYQVKELFEKIINQAYNIN